MNEIMGVATKHLLLDTATPYFPIYFTFSEI
jgi:hypothetical protein